MTDLDLSAVRARHGIRVAQNEYGRWIGWGWGLSCSYDHATESDAICALLKARWGMTGLRRTETPNILFWSAFSREGRADGPTELAAVVALADQLASEQTVIIGGMGDPE